MCRPIRLAAALEPTLLRGSVSAAYPVPPSAMNTAIVAMTLA